MRVRIETAAGFQAFSGIFSSPNSSAIQEASLDSVTSSNRNSCAAACATSSHRDAGSPEIVSSAIANTEDSNQRSYFSGGGGGSGRSVMKVSSTAFQLPSGSLRHTVRYLPSSSNLLPRMSEKL